VEIELQAAVEKATRKQHRDEARLKAIEDWTVKKVGDHIFVTF
jgi:hypothetical protein